MPLVDVSRLDPRRQSQAAIIAKNAQLRDGTAIAAFAAGPQRKLSGFLDRLLAAMQEETGPAADWMTELKTAIEALGLQAVEREVQQGASLLASLPLLGRYYSARRRLQAMQDTALGQLAAVERKAELQSGKLKAGDAAFDRLMDATADNLRELEAWVAGGEHALARMRADLEAERPTQPDAPHAAPPPKPPDAAERIEAFEAQLARIHATASRVALCIPPLRMARQAGLPAFQETLDTILLDLPGLKAAIPHAARQNAAGADVEQLSRIGDKILSTLDKGAELERKSRLDQAAAVEQLSQARNRLLEGLRGQAEVTRQLPGTEFR